MHPIGQILNHDDRREFQQRSGLEHAHVILHVKDAPKIDENTDSEVRKFIDKYTTCELPDKVEYPELHDLVASVQTHHHTTTCRKKIGVRCRFDAPWPPSDETCIIRGEDISKGQWKKSKKILDKVLEQMGSVSDLDDITLHDILISCGVSYDEYITALEFSKSKLSIIYKRKPVEQNISPYNPVLLGSLKSNMNLQFVTGVYGLLAYLTSYMCKPERNMSELMKKALKEASGKDIKDKLRIVGNVFKTKRECSLAEATKRTLSLPLRSSNIDVVYIPTGIKENRTRMLKDQSVIERMDPDDTNVYKTNMLEKYANRPDNLEDLCYADFATNYTTCKSLESQIEGDDVQNYTMPVNATEDTDDTKSQIISLKNKMGKMKKRQRPCVMRYHKISKLKDSEQYFMTLLQLYMPWRNEDELKGNSSTYCKKYQDVLSSIQVNIKKHNCDFEKYDDVNLDDVRHFSESESESDIDSDYGMLNPDLIDMDHDDEENNDDAQGSTTIPVPSTTIDQPAMSNEMFYEMCSSLNWKQQELFNILAKHAMESKLADENNVVKPDPYYIFLSGGAGVGKSYMIKVITEYLRKILKYPGQNEEKEPSVVVTASTGKAAANIDGTTAHSAFSLPLYGLGSICNRNLGNERLHILRHKFRYLQVLLIDEISMIGEVTFNDLDIRLQKIMNNDKPFGGISIMLIGDLMQLPPVKQKCIFDSVSYNRELFKLHELTEIVRQSTDPEFAEILNRLRENKYTDDDIEAIKLLADTDTSDWPDRYVELYMYNHLVNRENANALNRLTENENVQLVEIRAKDSSKDVKTGSCKVTVKEDTAISSTGNLPGRLKICVGAKVMLTLNVDIEDKLINGSLGTVRIIDRVRNSKPNGIIYVEFDDEKAGNKLKLNKYPKIRGLVPIYPRTIEFSYRHNTSLIKIERKQFPLILAESMTVHKAQGSGFDYMLANLDQTSKSGKGKAPINPGMVYTLLSRAKSRTRLKLLNFKGEEQIKINNAALAEMLRMRNESLLLCEHPINKLNGKKICLFNIRSWNLHIEHFLSDKYFATNSSVFCFTETNTRNSRSIKELSDYCDGWTPIHNQTEHGLAICYNTSEVTNVERLSSWGVLELLPVKMTIDNDCILLILIYRSGQGSPTDFAQSLMIELTGIRAQIQTTNYRTLVMGDFNLPGNKEVLDEVFPPAVFHQRSRYSTHIHGGILDLVFDDRKSDPVEWVPSPYSDHFVILID